MYNDDLNAKISQLCRESKEYSKTIKELELQHQYVISQITHEIRNPLTLISSSIQLLHKHYPELANDNLFLQITEDINNLSLLLNRITIYNHSTNLNYESTNILSMLNTLIKSFHTQALHQNKKISITTPPQLTDELNFFYCDGVKMRQVFTNLIKNALEAMSDNDILYINLEYNIHNPDVSDDTNSYLSISFKDNGIPIDPNELDHIFLPFITTKAEGTGMGLPITKEIIHAHGGFITCNSDTVWTEFKIYLPINKFDKN